MIISSDWTPVFIRFLGPVIPGRYLGITRRGFSLVGEEGPGKFIPNEAVEKAIVLDRLPGGIIFARSENKPYAWEWFIPPEQMDRGI